MTQIKLAESFTNAVIQFHMSLFLHSFVTVSHLVMCYLNLQFLSYNILMKMLRVSEIKEWNYLMNFIAGIGAGSMATVVSFPFDTIRTRLVAQSSNHRVYHGVLHSCR